jgi:glycine/D-amino acid oxidase-like deaminating enzyme
MTEAGAHTIAARRYPLGDDGYPVPNYVLADDAARPRFGSNTPLRRDGEPVILVIGAGYTGLAASLRLAELRAAAGSTTRIVLLEQDRVASGPSGKSAGHICGLQASDAAVRRHCDGAPGDRLIEAATEASRLVRRMIEHHAIPCDLRDGYVLIQPDGRQTVTEGGTEFGIDPYPFALGLAFAAERLGVEIYENATVTGLEFTGDGCVATTTGGTINVACALASGGHRMAETIGLLAPLRRRTTELMVSTIITDPIPDALLSRIMPRTAGRRFPFANTVSNVAYGSFDRSNRIIFGARSSAIRDPDPARIMHALAALLPNLLPGYRAIAGRELGWRPLVEAEKICFTRDRLPNVGTMKGHPNIHYVQALGGHGLALGTLLGVAAAEKIWGVRGGETGDGASLFDAFAAVPHGWLPPGQPWRGLAAALGMGFMRFRAS